MYFLGPEISTPHKHIQLKGSAPSHPSHTYPEHGYASAPFSNNYFQTLSFYFKFSGKAWDPPPPLSKILDPPLRFKNIMPLSYLPVHVVVLAK